MHQNLLKPVVIDEHKNFRRQKRRQEKNYNVGTRELEQLKPGEEVRIAPVQGRKWIMGTVLKEKNKRQYDVRKEDGGIITRNRRDLRKTKQKPMDLYEGMDL